MKISHVLKTMVIVTALTLTACLGHKDPTGPIGQPEDESSQGGADMRAFDVP